MTEVLGNNGYNGYVAGNPSPQLQGRGNAETNNRDEFQKMAKMRLVHSQYQQTQPAYQVVHFQLFLYIYFQPSSACLDAQCILQRFAHLLEWQFLFLPYFH